MVPVSTFHYSLHLALHLGIEPRETSRVCMSFLLALVDWAHDPLRSCGVYSWIYSTTFYIE